MIASSQFSNLMILFGTVSCFACSLVLLTVIIFKDLRRLTFVRIITLVTVNDLIASLGFSMGKSPNGSFQCSFQAFVTNFNYLSALFWCTVISLEVFPTYILINSAIDFCKYCIICQQVWASLHIENRRVTPRRIIFVHCVCWGIPLLVTLLPLTTNTYGKTNDDSVWCFIGTRAGSPSWGILVWDLCSFFVWLWLVLILNIWLITSIIYRLKTINNVNQIINWQVAKLCLYPIMAIICWAPATIMNIIDRSGRFAYHTYIVR